MSEAREVDEVEQVPIPLKNVSPAIPKDNSELKELVEDLTRMGCEGLFSKPWNLRSEATLREFLFEKGNQWFRILRQDPEKWTAEVWAKVYGFSPRKCEGWANWKDNFYVGKFRGDRDQKDGFHPGNCQNNRERRVIEFIMPILSQEKPKQLNITMANTLFGPCAKSGLSIGEGSFTGTWRGPFPTLAGNHLSFPPTSSTSISSTDASTKLRRML
jgi:hypothetical protein